MGIGSIISTPTTFVSTGMRHALDIDVAFGLPSSRFNARDDYRRKYSGTQRLGAGYGVAIGTAIPALALMKWHQKGWNVGQLSGAPRAVGVGVGALWLGGAAVAGGFKMKQIVEDDGHFGAVGSTAGMMAGVLAGYRFGGRRAPLMGALGGIAGAIGGYNLGERLKYGEGHIGQEAKNTTKTHTSLPGTAVDFGRGAFTQFTETGPTTQGISLGNAWGMRDSFQNEYSDAERGGAMLVGDLGAAGLMGLGALGTAKTLAKSKGGVSGLPQMISEGSLMGSMVVNNATKIVLHPGSAVGMTALAAGLGGFVLKREYDNWAKDGKSPLGGALRLGAMTAGGAAGAMVMKSFAKNVGATKGAQNAAALLGVATAVSVLSAMRTPVQQFVYDAQAAHKTGDADKATTLAAAGAGGVSGLMIGMKVAKGFVGGGTGKGKLILAGSALAGAALGAGAGFGMSATMPSIDKVGISAGIGAAALGGLNFLITKNARGAMAGAFVGGVLGTLGSSVMGKGQPVDGGNTPQIPEQ